MIVIRELLWDEANTAHIWTDHHRTREEVEEVCYGDPSQLYIEDTYGARIRIIGPRQDGTGRLLVIILRPKGDDTYYVVTAKPPKRQETRRYKAWKAGTTHE